jgi:hypothetical protein
MLSKTKHGSACRDMLRALRALTAPLSCSARKVNNNKIDEKRSKFGSAQPMTHEKTVQKETINGALATRRQ